MKLIDRILNWLGLTRISRQVVEMRQAEAHSHQQESPPQPQAYSPPLGISHASRCSETLNGVDMAMLGKATHIAETAPGQISEHSMQGYLSLADGSIVTSMSDTPCSLCYVCLQEASVLVGSQVSPQAIFPRALWPTASTVTDVTGRRLCHRHAVHIDDDPRTGFPVFVSTLDYEVMMAQQPKPGLQWIKDFLLGS